MTDIYSIKDIVLGLPISPIYTIIVCIIFLGLYFLVFRKDKKNIKIVTEVIIKEKINYQDLLNSIDFLSMNSIEFLKEISIFFRSYIEDDLNINDFSKLTFSEIKNLNINTNYKDLIEEIYFKEYKEEDISEKDKKRIFNNIKKIILKL